MRIAVAGGLHSINLIREIAGQTELYVELEYLSTESYPVMAEELRRRQQEFDGVLFTGMSPLHYASECVSPTIPWEVLHRSQQALLCAMLKASYVNHWDLSRISADSYQEDLIRSVYRELGMPAAQVPIQTAAFRPADPDYIQYLLDFHVKNYRSGAANTCITGIDAVEYGLREQNIPCVQILPLTETIVQKINKLRLDNQLKLTQDHTIATILVEIVPQRDHLFGINELGQFRERNIAKEYVYIFGQSIGAAIFEIADGRFVLFTTRVLLEHHTRKLRTFSLFRDIGQCDNVKRVFVGIGFGTDARTSKQNAETGVNRARGQKRDCLFIVYENGRLAGPIKYSAAEDARQAGQIANRRLLQISRRTEIGLNTLQKLQHVLRQYSIEVTTPQALAEILEMSPRSMNRLLAKLDDGGYLKVVGKESRGSSGRPSRLIQIDLEG
ncbi:MAG: hypothetical protein HFF39_05630 [Lawsonibacter sp.]|nr:hypothetical protein [Lawsonibacter sp.]